MEVTGWCELVLRMPGRAWCNDGVTGTGSTVGIPEGDVTSGGATARNVAMLMDDRFKVPDCILSLFNIFDVLR